MNTLILEHAQFLSETDAQLNSRQAEHITKILKSKLGDTLTVGKLNGKMGTARLAKNTQSNESPWQLCDIQLNKAPPANLPLTLILALPRPQMLKRILQTIATFGVEKLVLIHSNKVEKSFWQSPSATDMAIREQLILGLEQAKATQLPEVLKFSRFKPFINDHSEALTKGSKKIVAHPGNYPFCPSGIGKEALSLAIGPEGGFTQFEIDLMQEAGFEAVQLGERILKVETAVTTLLGRIL